MNLKEELQKLVELQKIDLEIYNLRNQKEVFIPQQIEKLKQELENAKTKLSNSEKILKDFQLKRKNKELELASKEEAVKKAQAQLYQLKTNKEYQAKLAEIASLKADVSVLEEEILKIFDEVEAAEKKFNEEKEKFSIYEKQILAEQQRLKSEISTIDDKIQQFKQKRIAQVQQINPNILAKYEKLLDSRQGVAIAAVDTANECCTACHMRVTTQTINEIKMYENLIFCENCVRILYVPEDIQ